MASSPPDTRWPPRSAPASCATAATPSTPPSRPCSCLFVAEPLLTGLGAGGYMLVAGAGTEPALLDFFVEAPGRPAGPEPTRPMTPYDVDFGDAVQTFHVGAASCGVYGAPAGVCAANARFGTRPLAELAAPAARLARDGVPLNLEQAYVLKILEGLVASTPEGAALFAPGGRRLSRAT